MLRLMINDKHFRSLEKVGVLQKNCYLVYFLKAERNPAVLLKSQSCGQENSLTLSLEISAPSPQGQSKQVVTGSWLLHLSSEDSWYFRQNKQTKKRNKKTTPQIKHFLYVNIY